MKILLNKILSCLLTAVACLIFTIGFAQSSGADLLSQMVENIKELNAFSGEMKGKERVDGEIVVSHSQMIIQFEPRKMYALAFDEDGQKSSEILYKEGENNEKVLVAPNGFPYVNVSLDPFSSFMRNNRHNTILEAGGTYLAQVINNMLERLDSAQISQSIKYEGIKQFQGKSCHHVIVQNLNYAIESYTPKKGETIRSIAMSKNVAEYRLLELNEELDDYDDSVEGLTINLPNSYSQKTVLYLDVTHLMPWFMANYDDSGLFSSYTYKSIIINPTITPLTFSDENPDYGF